ncbi:MULTISPECIES: hypothetical protein [Cyanophyceae]|uniref:hypothetical protein n=1 Tax=Cyanophyceae TaxID=3028117 RepID=UPI001685CB98|nr:MULTISPECIES: hypothetical protein [Cyanophyceae]MBD1914515.1 hypothetical protein [Phormidium sp. FACHB-77]MBD2031088.1 hypothetical protein [Phormidium sp. FACHB-322]MBD2052079.1 hypothetical protein [Leptolyngbya sp. FACHB-60]
MSHLFATALLLTLGIGSAGLLTVSAQPTQAQAFNSFGPLQTGLMGTSSAVPALDNYLAQVETPLAVEAGIAETGAASASEQGQPLDAIAATICANLPQWERPSAIAQSKQLEAIPYYGEILDTDPMVELAKAWWSHEIFVFTTYGLSARTDPLYLSGVWTAMDDMWDCYSGDQPEQINQGELAEMWLLHHRLVDLEWQDNQYLVTVEPIGTGLQLVQFPRRESGQTLPLSIVSTTGQALAVMSGDW